MPETVVSSYITAVTFQIAGFFYAAKFVDDFLLRFAGQRAFLEMGV